MAAAAAAAGADRIFMMGYDYHGPVRSPVPRRRLDRQRREDPVAAALDLYGALGVPADRLLGLPLYGVDWPVADRRSRALHRPGRGLVPA